MYRMRGVYPPMITPFKKNGDLDLASLEKLVDYLSERVQGLFICGSYGCGPMMSIEERKQVAETTMKVVNGRASVICHTGTTNTRDTIELSLHAKNIGCDAIASVGPYYFTHSEEDLLSYYSDIIHVLGEDYPIYLYNNPKFQGYSITLSTIKKLKAIGLHGIKDATFDITNFTDYMQELADMKFDIALGTEGLWLPARALGCEAFIPGMGNAFPELCEKMWQEGMANNFTACRETQFLVNKVRKLMYIAGSTQKAVYAMASIRGIIDANPRLPFVAPSDEEKAKMKVELSKIGVI
ncbi:MAG: dihydrodipicolinate synthase family protein [Methanobacterium sp.]